MKVLVRPWDGRVEGLGDGRDLPVGSQRLGGVLELALSRGGAERVDDGRGVFTIDGGTVLGPHVLDGLARLDLDADARIRLGGRTGELLEAIALGGESSAIGYLQGGIGDLDARLAEAPVVELDPEEGALQVPMPGGDDVPLSDRFAIRVRHPVQLLWANLLSLPPQLWRHLAGEGILAMFRIAGAVVRARSTRHEDLAQALTRIDPTASVHPSAVVEASVLGAGARVGPGAVVRGSILASDARVEALGICEGAVLGRGAVVQRQALCRYCVLADEAMLGGAAQLAVFGARSSLKRGSYAMDQGLGRDVRVPIGGRFERAPLGLAGPTFGEGVQVGSGVWIAPGRVLPPGIVVLGPDPLRDPTPPEGPGPFRVRDGRLA